MNNIFNGAELRLARIFNNFSLDEVADKVGKTRQYIHKLESGQAAPTELLLRELAFALCIEPEFLKSNLIEQISEEQFHFRKQFTTRAMSKQVAMAHGELMSRLVNYLEDELFLPEIRLPKFSVAETAEDVESAAEQCRAEWGIGLGPIANMNLLAENLGVIVTSFQSISKEVDALSVAVSRPIIVRNEAKESICRQRFDIGHELGHFVLHSGMRTGDRVTESQANRFASALLIPRAMMTRYFPKTNGYRLDWGGIANLKLTWKVSKIAILYRAHELCLISDAQYKSGIITLRRNGQATREWEDDQIAVEQPELLYRSIKILESKRGIQGAEIANELKVTPKMLNEIVGFEVAIQAEPQKTFEITTRPNLYRVK
jgi:Zn-dependent peptidase ImmA (M78 family)/transcriptional regulator with XRE-family HTH domain